MTELYDVEWKHGDLGLSFGSIQNGIGVKVERVTGRGAPIGLKHVQQGDVLVAINDEKVADWSTESILDRLKQSGVSSKTLTFIHAVQKEPEEEPIDRIAMKAASRGEIGRLYRTIDEAGWGLMEKHETIHGHTPLHVAV